MSEYSIKDIRWDVSVPILTSRTVSYSSFRSYFWNSYLVPFRIASLSCKRNFVPLYLSVKSLGLEQISAMYRIAWKRKAHLSLSPLLSSGRKEGNLFPFPWTVEVRRNRHHHFSSPAPRCPELPSAYQFYKQVFVLTRSGFEPTTYRSRRSTTRLSPCPDMKYISPRRTHSGRAWISPKRLAQTKISSRLALVIFALFHLVQSAGQFLCVVGVWRHGVDGDICIKAVSFYTRQWSRLVHTKIHVWGGSWNDMMLNWTDEHVKIALLTNRTSATLVIAKATFLSWDDMTTCVAGYKYSPNSWFQSRFNR